MFHDTTRIIVLCRIGSASKPYCRRAGFFDLVRCAQVRWARKGWLCCCISFQGTLVHESISVGR